jgi:hypothetical protein
MPGFPADRYGFTTADRLYWADIAVDYLVNTAGIEFLADLRFEDGSPVYNERELKHMVDVKNRGQRRLIRMADRVGWPAAADGVGPEQRVG